jgi:endonuclease/exonuclease/phosphatase (EEP) superfamily protein YafD
VLAQEARQAGSKGPVILFGDLNCSPWSYFFDKLLTEGDLSDSEQGFGAQASWCAWLIVPPIPIDHCLVSKNISVEARETLPEVGSDHLPVLVKLKLSQL